MDCCCSAAAAGGGGLSGVIVIRTCSVCIAQAEPRRASRQPSEADTADLEGEDSMIHLQNIIPANELVLFEEIGCGAEGKVFLGKWHGGEVAAKEFLIDSEIKGRLASASVPGSADSSGELGQASAQVTVSPQLV